MTAKIITLADENMLLDDAIALAKKADMFLISNGRRAVISPVIPMGWTNIVMRGHIPAPKKES